MHCREFTGAPRIFSLFFQGNAAILVIEGHEPKRVHSSALEPTGFLITSCLCKAGLGVTMMIKGKCHQKLNVPENEDGSVQSDSKVWKIVQRPTGHMNRIIH